MSKRKNTQIDDYFGPKKRSEAETNDENDDNESISSNSSSNWSKPSKPNHNVQFTLEMGQITRTDGKKNLLFDFILHLLGTTETAHSSDRDLSDALDSTLKINIEGTAHDNVEISVRIDSE